MGEQIFDSISKNKIKSDLISKGNFEEFANQFREINQ